MKKFLYRISIFFIPILIYAILAIIAFSFFLEKAQGPNTKQQLSSSFRNAVEREYDILALGNSRMYRGVNPDKFEMGAYNFSHDNDSYNQLYYKLEYLKEKGVDFKYLVLNMDYFQFSFKSNSRNYIYNDLLAKPYAEDFPDNTLRLKMNYYLNYISPKKIPRLIPEKNKPFHKDNGQYIREGKASPKDRIARDPQRLAFQVGYFEKILKHCENNDIQVFLVTLPVRKNELAVYEEGIIEDFKAFIQPYTNDKVLYWDFSLDPNFDLSDYADIAHFNAKGADKFSLQLSNRIMEYEDGTKED